MADRDALRKLLEEYSSQSIDLPEMANMSEEIQPEVDVVPSDGNEALREMLRGTPEQREQERIAELDKEAMVEKMATEGFDPLATPGLDFLTKPQEDAADYVSPVAPQEPIRSVASATEKPVKPISQETVEKKSLEAQKQPVDAPKAPDAEKPMSELEKLMSDYEARVGEARKSDKIQRGIKGVLDAFGQYDLAGGPQFAGLKAIKSGMAAPTSEKEAKADFAQRTALMKQIEAKKEKSEAKALKREELDIKRKALETKKLEKSVKQTKGQEAMDKAFGTDYAKYAAGGGYTKIKTNLDKLRKVTSDLKTKGLTGGLVEKFAPEGVADYTRAAFQEEAQQAKDTIEQVIQQSLKITLGGQFSEKEAAQLIKRSYNPALSPQMNIERLNSTINQLEEMAKAKDEASRHFEKEGTLKGFKGRTSFSASDINPDTSSQDTVMLEAPNGTRKRVKKSQAEKYIKKGAKLVQ